MRIFKINYRTLGRKIADAEKELTQMNLTLLLCVWGGTNCVDKLSEQSTNSVLPEF
jgi:hypothetical protein